jgi:hypothetical protein
MAYAPKAKIILITITLLLLVTLAVGSFLVFRKGPSGTTILERTSSRVSELYHIGSLARLLRDQEPERVLLLLQNDAELRPTGGFITAFAEFEIVGGKLSNLVVTASDAIELPAEVSVALPQEMQGLLSTEKLELRDANWDVDFATSAATIERMFVAATGRSHDMVIGMTTKTNEHLIGLTGPITFDVNGHRLTLDQTNVTSELQRLTDLDYATLGLGRDDRKMILAEFAQALAPKLEDVVLRQPLATYRIFENLLTSYDIQAISSRSDLAEHFEALRTAQTVNSTDSDALLIVDSNLGSRKTDPFIEQSANYSVDLTEQSVRVTLEISYKNTASEAPLTTDYKDYLRIYVPHGSTLVSSSQPMAVTERHGRTVFGTLLNVPVGQARTLQLSYTLPQQAKPYQLSVQRQPGGRAIALTIRILDAIGEQIHEFKIDRDHTIQIES